MDSLTEEQRKRMEENRQKAILKRAAALVNQDECQGQQTSFALPSTSTNTINVPSTSTNNTNLHPKSIASMGPTTSKIFPSNQANKPLAPQPNVSINARPNPPSPKPQNTPIASSYSVTTSGSCTLMSRDRFVVKINYHPQLIAVFKTIPGGSYDPASKTWNFPITEHGALMVAVNSLKPFVAIGPLPRNVLKIFSNPAQKLSTEVDPSILSKIDPELVTSLFEFQKEGICFGVRLNGRCLIADDMGLGKTIQGLGIAHYYYDEWPMLIATPSSMRFAWKEAIWKWLPRVPAGSIVVIESSKDMFQGAKVLIMSYDILQRRHAEIQSLNCKVVIMDECHHLKNSKSARTKAALPLIQKANRAILLSGTPCLSRPIELYCQISAIDKRSFPNIQEYGIRYCDGKKNAWGWDYSGSSNMEELQLVLKETVMIRRLKTDVLKQLPPKIRKTIPLDMGGVKEGKGLQLTRTAFNQIRKNTSEKRGKLLEYYAETGRVKLNAAVDYIKDLIEQDKKFLCFAHHLAVMDGVCKALDSLKTKYIRIDGTTSSEERHYLCEQFQFRDDVRVAVLSISAASSGITLTAANLVLFVELYWNPGILTQAEDRAHRIGQEDSVLIEYLVAPGTADDVLWPMVSNKLDILNKAGLSKDNFRDADVQLTTKKKIQKGIDEYFPPIEELEALFSEEFEDESDVINSTISNALANQSSSRGVPEKKSKY